MKTKDSSSWWWSSSFPPALADMLEEADLASDPSSIAAIDARGAILWANRAWRLFAEENGAPPGAVESWRSYFDGISGAELRSFYEAAFADALARQEIFEQEYECSSPDLRRLFRLRALPMTNDMLLVEHTLVSAESRETAPAEFQGEAERDGAEGNSLEDRYLVPTGLISQCGNCRRVRDPASSAWHWVRRWVERPHPKTSHGICASCVGFYWAKPMLSRQNSD